MRVQTRVFGLCLEDYSARGGWGRMTLLDEYRRAVYAPSEDERRRRLSPLTSVRPVNASGSPSTDQANRNGPRYRGKKLKPARSSIRLETISPLASTASNEEPQFDRETKASVSSKNYYPKHNEVVLSSNQQDSGSPANAPLQKKSSILNRLVVMAAAAERQGSSHTFCTPSELPSQFIHSSAHINVSRWTTIVSDVTLHRIAARNRRAHNTLKNKMARLTLTANSKDERDGDDTTLTRSIIINGAEQITDNGLAAVADSVPTLEALEIAYASQVTDAGLRALAAKCPLLHRLNLSSCSGIKGAGLGAIAELCPRVRYLHLADCVQLGDWVLQRCFYSFASHLEHLNVARCTQVTDNLLKTLAYHCPNLTSVQLADCIEVSDLGVVHLAQRCSKLQRVTLSRSQKSEKITDTCCAALGEHCPLLREVHLSGCNFLTDAGIKWIADGCPLLETMDLTNVFYATDASMRALGNSCRKLRFLRITNVKNVSDVGLRFLSTGCQQLEVLHVSNLYLVSDGNNRDFGLEGLQAVAKGCLNLIEVNLSGCFQLVERALVALGNGCRHLTKVNLKACPKITLLAVNALLQGCPSLATLNLSGVLLCNNAMLAAIGTHGTSLKELYVAGCDKVSDLGIRHLARRADQFEVLDFSGCSLISDVGISALIDAFQHPALAHLYLAGCSLVTQDPISRLAFACPLLMTLSLHGCRVSARVLQSLSSSWPFGRIRVPSGLAANQSGAEFGIFPVHRAKDKRYVEESCELWSAAVKVQNLFRRRIAQRDALLQLERSRREYVARRMQSIWRGRKARREALLRRLLQSGLEKSAIKIQRQYRLLREKRKVNNQMHAVFEKQIEKYVVYVQRRYRAKRAASIANAICRTLRKQRKREVAAAILLQRRYRGIAARKRFSLMQLQKQVREREEREASQRIQAIYRGRMDRKKAKQAEIEKLQVIRKKHESATRIQAHVRRRIAWKEAKRRRAYKHFQEQCAVRLQTAFRARRARASLDLLRLAHRHGECERAAIFIQRHWRGRMDRLGFAVLAEAKRRRLERELNAAVYLQRTFRRYMIRRLARGVMEELLRAKRHDENMEVWAATLVQAHWRRIQAIRELEHIQAQRRSRWKQLIDTYNQHGMGFGAPFFYNQVNGEIRWRMPREILTLQPRPGCDQCESSSSASVECATCCEFFCDGCHEIVHGRGKRRTHSTRKLFNFYGIRCDYGDGEFPSTWPSEILRDREREYDFVMQRPKEHYQEMLWQIAQFVPVESGPRATRHSVETAEVATANEAEQRPDDVESGAREETRSAAAGKGALNGVLFMEADVDEDGNSLWESFYDYASQEYRYYHRVSKRVARFVPSEATTDS